MDTMWIGGEAVKIQCLDDKCQPDPEIQLNKGLRKLEINIYTIECQGQSC